MLCTAEDRIWRDHYLFHSTGTNDPREAVTEDAEYGLWVSLDEADDGRECCVPLLLPEADCFLPMLGLKVEYSVSSAPAKARRDSNAGDLHPGSSCWTSATTTLEKLEYEEVEVERDEAVDGLDGFLRIFIGDKSSYVALSAWDFLDENWLKVIAEEGLLTAVRDRIGFVWKGKTLRRNFIPECVDSVGLDDNDEAELRFGALEFFLTWAWSRSHIALYRQQR